MLDSDGVIQQLAVANPLRESLLRAIIDTLRFPTGSRGLDAGCGIGLQAVVLAEAIGPDGHVTGMDVAPAVLSYAAHVVGERGLAERITFEEGDVQALPFADDTFDWVWSADCVGYPAGNLPPVLRELTRVVKPGGTVALLAWSAQNFLPGYGLLEARLNATCSALAPYLRDQSPDTHFLRAARWMRAAGLANVAGRTFVGDIQAPLSDDLRRAMLSLFQMLWGAWQPTVTAEDWMAYQQLCQATSPQCVLNLPDYYAWFTYTVFTGTVPSQ